ncbi:tRNA (adenosine(37)-N6)-threonylcarbamoyltransferase complex transferase subunit TsaD [Patescibacteria group bacterium]|nr:tRNA (adenosine(37)-N6)-threonylcarbamoyltransferase complex transferase subunit TsaD [Patescibacteria group bacterium]
MTRILGIESSCDETAVAIVCKDEVGVLHVEKSFILSQIKEHAKYGGVVPEVAARQHLEGIFAILSHEINPTGENIDAIAVTQGPGLSPALRVGVETAKALAWIWNKPLLPISHMEGHIYTSWFVTKKHPEFPVLALIVSGGHTELILMTGHGKYERLGETLDDAAGEAFDKVAKMIGLPYPGGPQISSLAEQGNPKAYDFPRGLLDRPDLNFSFSGVKTSVLYMLRKNEEKLSGESFRADVAASFQEAVVDVLVRKTQRAVTQYRPKSVVLSGGVAANKALRERLKNDIENTFKVPVFLPPMQYTVDNAAMIAAVGCYKIQNPSCVVSPFEVASNPNLDIFGSNLELNCKPQV